MTTTLSKEAEEQILGYISKVVEAVDDEGLSPTDAIVKVARDGNMSPNAIRLVARAYNTGRQESQRKTASSILDKFASFPLADGEAALQQIYPSHVDPPSVARTKAAVSDEYSRPPESPQTAASRHSIKVAHAPMPAMVETPPEPYQESSEQRMRRAYNAHLKVSQACEEVRYQGSVARDNLLLAIGRLGDYFKQAGEVSFEQAEWVAKNYLGKQGETLMAAVHVRNNPMPRQVVDTYSDEAKQAASFLDGLRTKRAAASTQPPQSINWDAAPYVLMHAAIKAAEAVKESQLAYTAARKQLEKSAETLRPFDPARATIPPPTSIIPMDEPKEVQGSLGMATGIGLKSVLDQALSPKPKSELIEQQWMELEDPQHENELRKIQAQAMLQDFMANDEVISGYDPEEILRHYNELSSMTPRAATQPGVMRPLLRRRLQGAMEPFEAEQATNIEKGLQQTSSSTPDTARLGNAPASILG